MKRLVVYLINTRGLGCYSHEDIRWKAKEMSFNLRQGNYILLYPKALDRPEAQ
jgi:hypothetical protein